MNIVFKYLAMLFFAGLLGCSNNPASENILKYDKVELSGAGISFPTVSQSDTLKLRPNFNYLLKFTYLGNEEAIGHELIVDLFPDNLPQTAFAVTESPVTKTWEISSDQAEMTSATLRFFAFFPEGAQITITDVSLSEK